MPNRLTVVVSQNRSPHPDKRALEQQIVMELLDRKGVDVHVMAHLYDLPTESTGMLCCAGVTGDLVVCSWLYPRATRWILDRNGIRGQAGTSLLQAAGEEDEFSEDAHQDRREEVKSRIIDQRELPARRIYCLDLRAYVSATPYIEEIERIALEQNTQTVELAASIQGNPRQEPMARYYSVEKGRSGENGQSGENGRSSGNAQSLGNGNNTSPKPLPLGNEGNRDPHSILHSSEPANRRWYPVIDFSRCTNCLECIDFCLFGVYGLDGQETILVEQPDNCRLGCPACSRVCPENAIIFPQHKAPAIAGSPETADSMKIDLSQLFGAPSSGSSDPDATSKSNAEKAALEAAVSERDEQLRLAGRKEAGKTVSLPKRQAGKSAAHLRESSAEKLDRLIDAVDELEL